MRVFDPLGGPPNLDQFFRDYEQYFRDSDRYEHHLERLIAGYSRGDSADDLRSEFAFVVQKVVETDRSILAEEGAHHVFAHQGRYGEFLRDALILLTFGLCLRASKSDIAAVLACCDRGDPLLETLAGAAAPGLQEPVAPPQFQRLYDGLYAVLAASGTERERLVREYLAVWYSVKMEGFTFKDTHTIHDQAIYVGYWCFEAAGVVAAFDIDDQTFSGHPHYPRDLVAFYRSRKK
ncbi:MAG: DUF1911 domain-containing protein [Acidobacteriia bacterium]|nr:DUF1911 domain-containing protein [Terriglobia bacterium]